MAKLSLYARKRVISLKSAGNSNKKYKKLYWRKELKLQSQQFHCFFRDMERQFTSPMLVKVAENISITWTKR
jgi:hypothetical protein